jgi:hypothetical protein
LVAVVVEQTRLLVIPEVQVVVVLVQTAVLGLQDKVTTEVALAVRNKLVVVVVVKHHKE